MQPPADLRRVQRGFGALAFALGGTALVGWTTGFLGLKSLRGDYIPMAPNTALLFIFFGAAVFFLRDAKAGSVRIWLTAGVAFIAVLVSSLRLVEYATSIDFGVDGVILPVPSENFGLAPIGKMALPTALCFLFAGASLTLSTSPIRRRRLKDVAGASALICLAGGTVFLLGYLYCSPLLYDTHFIPMALNTAIAFVSLGVSLIAAAGRESFPLRCLTGPSVGARLLRFFLPFVVGTVCVTGWLTLVVAATAGAGYSAILSAALATVAILLASLLLGPIARKAGNQIERAEAALQLAHDELQQAHDLLETKVEERTHELSDAYSNLQRTHQALQSAHLNLKQAQSRMLQQAKMASLGQTAAGVAHEINNPLAFVFNNIAILRREVGSLHEILTLYHEAEATLELYQGELLKRIRNLAADIDLDELLGSLDGLMDRSREGLKRIQRIVEDLRDFAHLDQAELKAADLNTGVTATINIMRSLAAKQKVSLETRLAPLPTLIYYPAKINLVMQNLITNAIDACTNGGAIVVSTRTAPGGVEFEVSDTGVGIDPAIRERIFDPFFTTKPVGKGTGLGLSMSYGIIKDHGGAIDFESTPGKGTRFTVRLPLSPPKELADERERRFVAVN